MFLAGRQDIAYICDENPPAEVGGLQLRITFGPREITHVVPEYAILAKDFRWLGDAGGELRVYASRGPEYPGLNVI